MMDRDFDAHPYTADEQRVADWMQERAPDLGTGDDPIGFVLASYDYVIHQNKSLRTALIEIMDWINNWSPPMVEYPEWAATDAKVKDTLGK